MSKSSPRASLIGLALLASAASLPCVSFAGVLAGQSIVEAGAAVGAEFLKSAIAKQAVKEGLETQRMELRLQAYTDELTRKLKQPSNVCETMDRQEALSASVNQSRASVLAASRAASRGVLKPSTMSAASSVSALSAPSTVQYSTTKRIDAQADASKAFCTKEEASQGICVANSVAAYADLAGADQDAMFLFQSRDGGETFTGGRAGPQSEAVDLYINRVVSGLPREMPRSDAASNGAARGYIELERRYQAYLSMARYSLFSIAESGKPLK